MPNQSAALPERVRQPRPRHARMADKQEIRAAFGARKAPLKQRVPDPLAGRDHAGALRARVRRVLDGRKGPGLCYRVQRIRVIGILDTADRFDERRLSQQ